MIAFQKNNNIWRKPPFVVVHLSEGEGDKPSKIIWSYIRYGGRTRHFYLKVAGVTIDQ